MSNPPSQTCDNCKYVFGNVFNPQLYGQFVNMMNKTKPPYCSDCRIDLYDTYMYPMIRKGPEMKMSEGVTCHGESTENMGNNPLRGIPYPEANSAMIPVKYNSGVKRVLASNKAIPNEDIETFSPMYQNNKQTTNKQSRQTLSQKVQEKLKKLRKYYAQNSPSYPKERFISKTAHFGRKQLFKDIKSSDMLLEPFISTSTDNKNAKTMRQKQQKMLEEKKRRLLLEKQRKQQIMKQQLTKQKNLQSHRSTKQTTSNKKTKEHFDDYQFNQDGIDDEYRGVLTTYYNPITSYVVDVSEDDIAGRTVINRRLKDQVPKMMEIDRFNMLMNTFDCRQPVWKENCM